VLSNQAVFQFALWMTGGDENGVFYSNIGTSTSPTMTAVSGVQWPHPIGYGKAAGNGLSPRTAAQHGSKSMTAAIDMPNPPRSAEICVPSRLFARERTAEVELFGGRAPTRSASRYSPFVGLPS